ncbi:MAG: HAD family hydrolase [candidate division Zixibacteria bacterium]|nr:HAD family hydrolase [candidate division Zixibacteria bacterium]
MLENKKAVLFDLGSTLLEYEKFDWSAIATMGLQAGYKFLESKTDNIPSLVEISEVFHKIFTTWAEERNPKYLEINFEELVVEAFNEIGISTEQNFVYDFILAYYSPISEFVEPLEGSDETLRKLKDKEKKIVIVSNSIFPAYLHLEELRRFNLLSYINSMIFSCELGIKKPHPDIYAHALEIAGCNPEEALFIGDRYLEDIQGPNRSGIQAVLIKKTGREYPPEIEDYPACENHETLRKLLGLDY